MSERKGPLAGLMVVEMVGIGPAPLTAMMLADLGAEVIRIDRVAPSGLGVQKPERFNFPARGRRSVAIDLKHPEGVACTLDLIDRADALIEGFRPGVMERLGLAPEICLKRNPKLVYGRVTGWGQDGPLAKAAGHDLNYIALTGALDAIGRRGQPPTPPLNLLGDFAGGGLMLAFGIVAAMLHAVRSGRGQVVDAAMIDGVSLLSTPMMGLRAAGIHDGERGTNILDSGAPYYDVYRCADGTYISVAPIEVKFWDELLDRVGIDKSGLPDRADKANWPIIRQRLTGRFAEKTQAEWCAILEGTDACFAPVLSYEDATEHPHHVARGSFVSIDGHLQPAPAPRFSETPADTPEPPEAVGQSTMAALRDWGVDEDRITCLAAAGIVGTDPTNHET